MGRNWLKLISLAVADYRQFQEPTTVVFPPGLTGLCGPNGVGKSKLIEAIGYALYGPDTSVLPKKDKAADLPAKAAEVPMLRVELTLELHGDTFEIVRTPHRVLLRRAGVTETIADSPTGVKREMMRLLGLSAAAYGDTFVARQKEIAGLQDLGTSARVSLVNRLIGITMVERALAGARDSRRERAQTHRDLGASTESTPALATAYYDECAAAHRVAQAADSACAKNLEDAQAADQHAMAAVSQLRERSAALARACVALVNARAEEDSWTLSVESARARVHAANDATVELTDAEAVVPATAENAADIARHEALAEFAKKLRAVAELSCELTERLQPRERERSALQAALEGDDRVLRAFEATQTKQRGQREFAERETGQARQQIAESERRRQAAIEQGEGGICPTCGQSFGNNVHRAIEHYEENIEQARQAEREAEARGVAAGQREMDASAKIAALEVIQQDRADRLHSDETLPGIIEQTRRQIEELENQLAEVRTELGGGEYDAVAHTAAIATAERRQQALEAIARLQLPASGLEAARIDETRADEALSAALARRQNLEEAIAWDATIDGELAEAEAQRTVTNAALEGATERASESTRETARAGERVVAAEHALRQALEREQAITVARRALSVAEVTCDLLERLLRDITEEARPRLAGYMNDWAPSLLGPRFRSVDLTPDYRILADNGSGPHEIDHFSGGEQTLLAIMLRVAISLFCRERAGFDTGFLILDEVFGDQDAQHRTQLVQFLDMLRPHFHQVLIVNHVEDVTEMLESIIDVIPTSPNTSKAIMRTT